MRNTWIAYLATMTIAVVALSLLTYLGPPFGSTWATVLEFFGLEAVRLFS